MQFRVCRGRASIWNFGDSMAHIYIYRANNLRTASDVYFLSCATVLYLQSCRMFAASTPERALSRSNSSRALLLLFFYGLVCNARRYRYRCIRKFFFFGGRLCLYFSGGLNFDATARACLGKYSSEQKRES